MILAVINNGTSESRVKYVGKYRYVFRVFSLVFYKYVHVYKGVLYDTPNVVTIYYHVLKRSNTALT